jgi:valyl-tRNA synthetase
VIAQATSALDGFDYAAALQVIEESFWSFCDNYLELVKLRSYAEQDSPGRRSALATLAWGLRTFLRLLAPFLPYVTEEVWSWRFAGDGPDRSVHTTRWPALDELAAVPEPTERGTFGAAVEVLTKIRGAKTTAQKSLRWPVAGLQITGPAELRAALAPVLEDVLRAGNVDPGAVEQADGVSPEGERFSVTVELAAEMQS